MKKILCVLLVFSLLLLSSCSKKVTGEITTEADEIISVSEYKLGYDIYITDMTSFTGPFYEDGSNDLYTGMGVLLENRSDNDYQVFNFNITINGEIFEFECTTLLSGMKVFVLEKNKKQYSDGNISSSEITELGSYIVKPDMHTDVFSVETADGDIRVENISEFDCNNVYVYYKNISEDGIYLGGITYRVHIDYIRAGVVQQKLNETFSQENSKVVFVSYDEMY